MASNALLVPPVDFEDANCRYAFGEHSFKSQMRNDNVGQGNNRQFLGWSSGVIAVAE